MKGGPHYAVGAGSCATTWYACHNVVSRPYNKFPHRHPPRWSSRALLFFARIAKSSKRETRPPSRSFPKDTPALQRTECGASVGTMRVLRGFDLSPPVEP